MNLVYLHIQTSEHHGNLGLRFNLNKALNRQSFDKRETMRNFAW